MFSLISSPILCPHSGSQRGESVIRKSLIRKLGLIVVIGLVGAGASRSAWGGFKEGVAAYKRKDYATAFKELKPLAEQGNAIAQKNLGFIFFNGRGVEKNYKLALKWYRRSAKQGNARAQLNLGVMYNQGKGVPKDYKIAVMWYRKSAERGDAYAQYNLGIMYAYGWGVPRNYVRVHMWWTISSANRNKNAIRSRSGLEKKMTSKQIAEAKGLAREWMEKNRKK